jgi:hypothetical protein
MLALVGTAGCWSFEDVEAECVRSGRCVAPDGGRDGGAGGGVAGGAGGGVAGGAGGGVAGGAGGGVAGGAGGGVAGGAGGGVAGGAGGGVAGGAGGGDDGGVDGGADAGAGDGGLSFDAGSTDAGPCDYFLDPQPGDLCFHRFNTMKHLLGVVGGRDAGIAYITVAGQMGECFESGVVAPNGNIIAVPWDGPNPMVIPDMVTFGVTATSCTNGTALYASGVLSRSGEVFILPFFATSIDKVNPSTGVRTTGRSIVASQSASWWGGVVARDGRIVLSPFNSNSVGMYDPADAGLALWANVSSPTTDKFAGAVVTSTDDVWLVPNKATEWRRVALDAGITVAMNVTPSAAPNGSWGAVLGGDGLLYMPPFFDNKLWRVNTVTNTAENYGFVDAGEKFSGGALGHDGRIYMCPNEGSSTVLVIEPKGDAGAGTYRLQLNPSAIVAGTSYAATTTAMDGRTFCIPGRSTSLVVITPDTTRRLPPDVVLSPHFNKY